MQTSADPGSLESVDWEAIEKSEEFQELVHRKRAYVIPRVVFFLVWYLAFVLLAGYAEGFMGERIYEGLTVGYVLALSQFVMVWVLAVTYVRKANRDFDPLEQAVAKHVEQEVERSESSGRFTREPAEASPEVKA